MEEPAIVPPPACPPSVPFRFPSLPFWLEGEPPRFFKFFFIFFTPPQVSAAAQHKSAVSSVPPDSDYGSSVASRPTLKSSWQPRAGNTASSAGDVIGCKSRATPGRPADAPCMT